MDPKLVSEFTSLAKGNISKEQVIVCVHIFLDLCEVKNYWDIRYEFDSGLQSVYFIAKQTKTSDDSIFIPFSTRNELNFEKLQYCAKLGTQKLQKVFLVFIDPDSTCVYYNIEDNISQVSDS